MIFVAFMLMNLFIAIIIESYELRVKIEKTRVPARAFAEFMRNWQKYDTTGDGFIECRMCKDFILELPPPLGLPQKFHTKTIAKFIIKKIKIPVYKNIVQGDNHYYFYDLALALTKACLQNSKRYKNIDGQFIMLHQMLHLARQDKLEKYTEFKRLEFSSLQMELFPTILDRMKAHLDYAKLKILQGGKKQTKKYELSELQKKLHVFMDKLDDEKAKNGEGSEDGSSSSNSDRPEEGGEGGYKLKDRSQDSRQSDEGGVKVSHSASGSERDSREARGGSRGNFRGGSTQGGRNLSKGSRGIESPGGSWKNPGSDSEFSDPEQKPPKAKGKRPKGDSDNILILEKKKKKKRVRKNRSKPPLPKKRGESRDARSKDRVIGQKPSTDSRSPKKRPGQASSIHETPPPMPMLMTRDAYDYEGDPEYQNWVSNSSRVKMHNTFQTANSKSDSIPKETFQKPPKLPRQESNSPKKLIQMSDDSKDGGSNDRICNSDNRGSRSPVRKKIKLKPIIRSTPDIDEDTIPKDGKKMKRGWSMKTGGKKKGK